ncbi:MAG: hypothetical protein LBU46_06110 [Candidatus Accumulibacter sp.]|nr:hypothetical protein [Accumulibacter sp.]
MSWRIHPLEIPPSPKGKEGEVRLLIHDALDAWGWLYDRGGLIAVNVDFGLPS